MIASFKSLFLAKANREVGNADATQHEIPMIYSPFEISNAAEENKTQQREILRALEKGTRIQLKKK